MKTALLIAALLASPAGAAPAACDAFCASAKKIIAARGDGFASLRGKRSLGMIRAGTAVPPGARSCMVYPLHDGKLDNLLVHRTHYRCMLPADSKEAAQARYDAELKRLRASVPNGWTWRESDTKERYALASAGQEIVLVLRKGDDRDFRGFLEVFAALPFDQEITAGRRKLDNAVIVNEDATAADILMDGKPLGRLAPDNDFFFHAPPGAHSLKAVRVDGKVFEYALNMRPFDRILYLNASKLGDHDEEDDGEY